MNIIYITLLLCAVVLLDQGKCNHIYKRDAEETSTEAAENKAPQKEEGSTPEKESESDKGSSGSIIDNIGQILNVQNPPNVIKDVTNWFSNLSGGLGNRN